MGLMTTFLDPMETSSANSSAPSERLVSLDALRGFDMFWIIGVDAMFATLHNMSGNKVIQFLAYQLAHSEWEGFRFYDLIFPLFVFIVGVSLVFSLSKTIEKVGRGEAIKRIFRRSLLLYALGVFYYGGFSNSWDNMRLVGVLPRIAFAYLFAGLLFCFFKPRTLVITCAGILIGYWALLSFVPFPNYRSNATAPRVVHGSFTQSLNLVGYFDLQYLPGDNGNGMDPEGLLSNIPAIASCLLGVFAGLLLKDQKTGNRRKVIYLLSFGVVSIALGWLWGLQFPVIKKLWTSSYVLVAGGYSAILLAAFYQIVDVWKFQKWCQPFVWIGMNAITIYMGENILGGYHGYDHISERFLGGDIRSFFEYHVGKGFGESMINIGGLLVAILLARFLYRRKIFLRV